VVNAEIALTEAKEALAIGMTFDAVTVSLEEAIENLLELTGERVSDVVVDNVFHNFCVGK
jgi:tRNA modification GTPase